MLIKFNIALNRYLFASYFNKNIFYLNTKYFYINISLLSKDINYNIYFLLFLFKIINVFLRISIFYKCIYKLLGTIVPYYLDYLTLILDDIFLNNFFD